MGNQNNMNYQNNNNVENQINNIITINNEINVNKDNHILPDVQTKACPSSISFLITGISVIADSLSIMDMILHNPIKLLFRFEDQNIKEIHMHLYFPIIIISVSLIIFAILYNLLRRKHFYRIIRKDNKLYFISKVKCANCERQTFAKLNYNCDTEQFTFTCKNCRHRFTYNFSDLYNILK